MRPSGISRAIRQQVMEQAHYRCEYCLLSVDLSFQPFEVDHIIARKHGGKTELGNLALSCPPCNKHKGSDIGSIDPIGDLLVPLFHPREDRWADHFRLDGAHIQPLTDRGRVTVFLLRFNSERRLRERGLFPPDSSAC